MGKPLYGDVFGITGEDATNVVEEDTVDKTPWGELESESESEEESEDEDEDEDQTGLVTPGDALVLLIQRFDANYYALIHLQWLPSW